MSKLIDLTGKRYGKLVVIERGDDYVCPAGSYVRWICRCDCGKDYLALGSQLRRGEIRSCGCGRKEIRKNNYHVGDKYTTIFIKDKKVLVDNEDFPTICNESWYIGANGYVYSNSSKKLLHRVLTECPQDMIVDHINHDTLDNRKENLRICDYSINGINKKCSSNTNLFYISKTHDGYVVYVRRKYIGYFKKLEDAISARNEAVKNTEILKYNMLLQKEMLV